MSALLTLGIAVAATAAVDSVAPRPNVVIIYTDDMGWTDPGCFGGFQTPHIDALAARGLRLTNFHAPQPICTPSRAGLLTGCYPNRIGMGGAALWIKAKKGLSAQEVTLPQHLKTSGYTTAIYGKWHLGDHPDVMPLKRGFDTFEGIPYSNSMWSLRNDGSPHKFPPLPYFRDTQVIDHIDSFYKMDELTQRLTTAAVNYIARSSADTPFFLYLAHPMPHVPLGCAPAFKGKSGQGLYGDVMLDIDHAVGRVVDALKAKGINQNTLLIFTSDNGPWLNYGNHGGTCRGLREGKGTAFEGGFRVPCVMVYPDLIPAGTTSNTLISAIDIFPTCAAFAGIPMPAQPKDGIDFSAFLRNPKNDSPRSHFLFYGGNNELRAVTDGRFKLVFKHRYNSYTGIEPGMHGMAGKTRNNVLMQEALYDLKTDLGETTDVAQQFPEKLTELKNVAETAREDLGDSLRKRPGRNRRPAESVK